MTKLRCSRAFCVVATVSAILSLAPWLRAADPNGRPNVQLNSTGAKPRVMEVLTSERIVRDYAAAWENLADALDNNAPELVGAYFAGPASDALASTIEDQQHTGVHSRYLSQSHKLDAVFYAPEGDVMELHDTMVCDLQMLDGAKVIHNEHVTLYYVVLMTPGADRWLVRQLQAVQSF